MDTGAKIQEHDPATVLSHHVVRLDVSMQQPQPVHG